MWHAQSQMVINSLDKSNISRIIEKRSIFYVNFIQIMKFMRGTRRLIAQYDLKFILYQNRYSLKV